MFLTKRTAFDDALLLGSELPDLAQSCRKRTPQAAHDPGLGAVALSSWGVSSHRELRSDPVSSPMVGQIAGISALALALGGGYWVTTQKSGGEVSVTAAAQAQPAPFLQPQVRNPRAQLNGPVGGVFQLVDDATNTTVVGISDNQKAARYAVAITLPNRKKITLVERISFTQPDASGRSQVSYAGTGRMSPTRAAKTNQLANSTQSAIRTQPAGIFGPEFTKAGKLKLTGKSIDITLTGSVDTRTGAGQVNGTAGQQTFAVASTSLAETPLQQLKDTVTRDIQQTAPGLKVVDPGRSEPLPGDCKNPKKWPKDRPGNPWRDNTKRQASPADVPSPAVPGPQPSTVKAQPGGTVAKPQESGPNNQIAKPNPTAKLNRAEPNQAEPNQSGQVNAATQQKPAEKKSEQQDPFADQAGREKGQNGKWPRDNTCWGPDGLIPGNQSPDAPPLPQGSYLRMGTPRDVKVQGVGRATAVVPAEVVDNNGKVTSHLRFAMEYQGGSWQIVERYSVSGPNR